MNIIKKFIPHLIALVLFAVVSYIYFMPNFNGKVHSESDMFQGNAMSTEINKYEEAEGKLPLWTNSIFFGMPSQILRGRQSTNLLKDINYLTPFKSTKYPFRIMFLSLIGFYILMLCMKINYKLAIVGALAYGLATFTISSIEAAHYTKALAMALMPAVLGGFVLLTRKKYFLGAIVLAFNLGLQTYYYHYQISYYTIIMLVVAGVVFAIFKIKEGGLSHVIKVAALSILAVVLALGSCYQKIKSTQDYAKNSMRGGSELAEVSGDPNSNIDTKGLSEEYAFQWSYGIFETLTGVIPRFVGGSSSEPISKSSDFYRQTKSKVAPTYFGDMPFTGGPIYFGALMVFLFVLGIIVSEGWIKWTFIAIGAVSLILAWGKNFGIINSFLFNYLPFYNKFRTPMMAFSIAQVVIPALGIYGLSKFIGSKESKERKMEMLKLTGYIVGGIIVAFGLVFSIGYSFEGYGDGRFQGNPGIIDLLVDLRKGLLRMDALRSLAFAGIGFAILWFYIKGRVKETTIIVIFGIAMLFDLGGVAVRYLSWDDFNIRVSKHAQMAQVDPTPADLQIMQDKSYYRVYDMSRDPFNDNTGAIFHKMIGGYHPAKLSRYQDIISRHLQKNNQKVLDMMNAKYLLGKMENSDQVIAQRRPTALGNAWFVNEVKFVPTALAEIDFLNTFDPATVAVAREEFKTMLQGVGSSDSADIIALTNYHPDTMVYEYTAKNDVAAVFSEMYYEELWQAYLDGEPLEHARVNYILRGAKLPAGKHTVTFIAEDKSADKDLMVERVSSAIILAGFPIYLLFFFLKKGRTEEREEEVESIDNE